MRRIPRAETSLALHFLLMLLVISSGLASRSPGRLSGLAGPGSSCQILDEGERGGSLMRQVTTVDRQEQLEDLWARLHPDLPAPVIDWNSRRVVVLFAGEHPGPGHRLVLNGTRERGEILELDVEEAVRPGRPEAGPSLPYLMLEAPSNRSVEIRWRSSLVTEVPPEIEG